MRSRRYGWGRNPHGSGFLEGIVIAGTLYMLVSVTPTVLAYASSAALLLQLLLGLLALVVLLMVADRITTRRNPF